STATRAATRPTEPPPNQREKGNRLAATSFPRSGRSEENSRPATRGEHERDHAAKRECARASFAESRPPGESPARRRPRTLRCGEARASCLMYPGLGRQVRGAASRPAALKVVNARQATKAGVL